MKEIGRRIRRQGRLSILLTGIVLAVVLVAGGYFLLPKVHAAQGDSRSEAIVLMQGSEKDAEPGKWYKITGNIALTQPFILNYTGVAGDQPVHLLLENTNIVVSNDVSAIILQGEGNDDYTANFQIHISGENRIRSTVSSANRPLIQAENRQYLKETFDYSISQILVSNRFKATTVNQVCNVTFVGDGSKGDVLTLTTAAGSMGAAIGSGELQTVTTDIITSLSAGSGNGTVDEEGHTYKNGQEFFNGGLKLGAANITVKKSANIEIVAQGQGAGIGTGASTLRNFTVTDKTLTNQTVNAENAILVSGESYTSECRDRDEINIISSDIKILGGTVSIKTSSLGNCLGTGAIADSNYNKGRITIKDASVYLNPQNTDSKKYYEVWDGTDTVYEYIFDIGAAVSTETGMLGGNTYPYVLTTVTGGENDFLITNNGVDLTAANFKDTSISLKAGDDYVFEGYADTQYDFIGADKLYFYLPIRPLQAYKISVNGNLNGATYAYGTDGMNFVPFTENHIRETQPFFIKITGVPKFCERIDYEITGGLASESYSWYSKSTDGTEYVFQGVMGSSDMSIAFDFIIGDYDIEYIYADTNWNISQDELNKIQNNNVGGAKYGDTINLEKPVWEGHTFLGWYYNQDFKGETVTEIMNDDLEKEIINLYAKWSCKVSFTDDVGNSIEIDGTPVPDMEVDMGSTLAGSILKGNEPADTEIREFIGWEIDGIFYDKNNTYPDFMITKDTVIKAVYHNFEYSVHISANYTDEDGLTQKIDVLEVLPDFGLYLGEEKVALTPITSGEVGDIPTYQTEDDYLVYTKLKLGEIKANKGYQLKRDGGIKIVYGEQEKDVEVVNNEFAIPGGEVSIILSFEAPDYIITYQGIDFETNEIVDMTPEEADGNPTVLKFNAKTPTFKLNPVVSTNKYKTFAGWRIMGTEEIITQIEKGKYSEDLRLVAKFVDVDTKPIIVDETVWDYIKVYDSDGKEVQKGIPGERLKIVVTVGRGVAYESMTYTYTDDDDGIYTNKKVPSEEQKGGAEYYFTMPDYPVNITGEFSLVQYTITYVNLLGAENDNPMSYNIADKIVLNAPVKEGYQFKEWTIVVPDEEVGYESVKELPITEINGQFCGNIMLVAHWENEDEVVNETHQIELDLEAILNGNIKLFEQKAQTSDTVFVEIIAKEGYQLKGLYYTLEEEPAVFRLARVARESTKIRYDISFTEISENIYYFIMPDSDVKLAAEFEPIVYNIEYFEEENGGTSLNDQNGGNPLSYNIESEITLVNAPARKGFEFLGWFDEDGNQVTKIETGTMGDLLLIARWKSLEPETPEPETPEPETPEPETPESETPQPETSEPETPQPETPQPETPSKEYQSLLDKLAGMIAGLKGDSSSEDTQRPTTPQEPATQTPEEETKAPSSTVKPTIIGNAGGLLQQITTGDNANIGHFVIICVAALVVVVAVLPKHKKKQDEIEDLEEDK